MLCLTLNGSAMEENRNILNRNKDYCDMVELRADFLNLQNDTEIAQAKAFPLQTEKPVILTLRRISDGGQCRLNEENRLKMLEQLSEGNFSFVDIEADAECPKLVQVLVKRGIKIIKSVHCYNSVPENFTNTVSNLSKKGYIPKLAVQINSVSDLTEFVLNAEKLKDIKHKIIVGMGDFGIPSRVLYKKLSSMLMYCSDISSTVAGGMLSAQQMKEIYGADSINLNTKIFGIIGNPVKHSKSPEIHNGKFRESGKNAVYVPFTIDNLEDFFRLAEILNIQGLSVTAPFKKAVIPFLAESDNHVKEAQACNTVVKTEKGWFGYNTDCLAMKELIGNDIQNGRIKNILVIGAGGAACAVISGLKLIKENISENITILNRTSDKAKSLAELTNCKYDSPDNAENYIGKVDLIVQTASTSKNIIPKFEFSGKETVLELVYNPLKTEILLKAEKQGCRIIMGTDFLSAQAKPQCKFFMNAL